MVIILCIHLGILSTKDCQKRGCMPVPLSFLNYISYELIFYADYANGYAIEATNDNGIHVLPMAMTKRICTIP
jgi:hypothetical protein